MIMQGNTISSLLPFMTSREKVFIARLSGAPLMSGDENPELLGVYVTAAIAAGKVISKFGKLGVRGIKAIANVVKKAKARKKARLNKNKPAPVAAPVVAPVAAIRASAPVAVKRAAVIKPKAKPGIDPKILIIGGAAIAALLLLKK
jgi:hypothetical protein